MPRYIRNSAILAKIESTVGSDATPTGAANAILVKNMSINPLNAQNVSRDLMRGYMGGSEQLIGSSYIDCSFDVELAGSGAAGTAPAWGALLRGCGMAEVISAGLRVDYTPISASFESLTIYYHDDGVLHKMLGTRGSVSLDMLSGNSSTMKFKFLGIDGGVIASANPSLTLTNWKQPLVITDPNSSDVTLGCTYSAGALVGGTAYPSQGLSLDIGNSVSHIPLLGGQSIEITQRDASGSVSLDVTAAQEVALMASVKANTVQGIGLLHGTASGYKILVHAPAVQMINPKKNDVSGRRMIGYDLRLTPLSGNDELRIVAL